MDSGKENFKIEKGPFCRYSLAKFMQSYAIFLLLLTYSIAGLLTIIFFDGTGDNGDSIMHYLFARFAPVHPQLYLDHWAKPLFVLISSPFAQFGFNGMKVFNLSVTILTFYITYLTGRSLGMQNPLLIVVFLICMPLYYILTFSGLTEPFFALFMIGAVFLAVRRKYIASAVAVSLMPFVRSEGLIIMLVFGCLFLVNKQWKYLPWLLTGHVVYSIDGYFVFHDFFWVFNKIPYSNLAPKYGSGPLMHFVIQLNYVIGIPLYFLLVAGIISYPVLRIKRNIVFSRLETILVLFGFFIFLIAHSLFWYFGIFNSMGLKRVLIGVAPLISLIALRGYNFMTNELFRIPEIADRVFGGLLAVYVIIFPFTGNHASINWKNDMNQTEEQTTAKAIATYIKEHPMPPRNKFLYTYPYLSEVMNVDHFDGRLRKDLSRQNLDLLQHGDVVVWDNWFAVIESNTTLDNLLSYPGLVREIDFDANVRGREIKFVVFRKE